MDDRNSEDGPFLSGAVSERPGLPSPDALRLAAVPADCLSNPAASGWRAAR